MIGIPRISTAPSHSPMPDLYRGKSVSNDDRDASRPTLAIVSIRARRSL
jgi:hypothetical protein